VEWGRVQRNYFYQEIVASDYFTDDTGKKVSPKEYGMPMPFDMKRMAYGGFETIVDL